MCVIIRLLACAVIVLAAMPAGAADTTSRIVTATAYTSRPSEIVNKRSKKTACEDHLDPKDKGQTIAVSPDLVEAGLDCGTAVTIHGLEGNFVVNDHLPKKSRNTIDIFMGNDVKLAKEWSHRQVEIRWTAGGAQPGR